MDMGSDHRKEMTYRVLRQVADDCEMVVLKKARVKLSIKEVVTPCDIVGTGIDGIYRFSSVIAALRSNLFIFPACLKVKLVQFEG